MNCLEHSVCISLADATIYRNSNFVFWFIWVFLVLGIFNFVELFACWQVSEANPKECIYEKTYKKVQFDPKKMLFSQFNLNQLFNADATIYRNSNFVFWFIWVFLVLGIFNFVELFACWQVSEANPKECIYEKTEGDSWEICVS